MSDTIRKNHTRSSVRPASTKLNILQTHFSANRCGAINSIYTPSYNINLYTIVQHETQKEKVFFVSITQYYRKEYSLYEALFLFVLIYFIYTKYYRKTRNKSTLPKGINPTPSFMQPSSQTSIKGLSIKQTNLCSLRFSLTQFSKALVPPRPDQCFPVRCRLRDIYEDRTYFPCSRLQHPILRPPQYILIATSSTEVMHHIAGRAWNVHMSPN